MKIVVGLGNPGREYAATRHNVGFMVVGCIARRVGAAEPKRRFRSELAEGAIDGEKLILVAPQTYMNLSGHAVREVVHWYRVPLDDVLVVLDDLDLPFGTLRLRGRGSAGGHRGLESIIEQLGTDAVPRLRIGIGRGHGEAISHVLARFNEEEARHLPEVIDRAADAALLWAREGLTAAMNVVNRRAPARQGGDIGSQAVEPPA